MFKNYLKIAWRNLLKSKSTSTINIVGLSVGMSVAIMIGLWMHDELTFNKFHKNYDRLAQVMTQQTFNGHTGTGDAVSNPVAPELRSKFGSDFQDIASASWNFTHLLTYGEKKFSKEGMWADPALPKMLSLSMVKGTHEASLKDPHSILLASSVASALFGTDDPMGKTIKVDNTHEMQVTGVFEDLPYNSEFHNTWFYMPWQYYLTTQDWLKNSLTQWDNHSFQLFVQLTDNADFGEVGAKIKDLEKNNRKDAGLVNPQLILQPMSKWHLYSEFKEGENVGGRIQYVRLFGIIGAFVLLLACINFMNLSTARSEKRAKEVGIRKAVGSVRGQLVGQFLSESLLVVALALVISMVLVQFSLPAFNQLADKQVSLPLTEPFFWLALVTFTGFTGLVAGSYPAFYLSGFQPLEVLKGTFKMGRRATTPRQVLVVVQFTVSIALIIGTLVVFNQIQHAKDRPVGYNREGLIQTSISSGLRGRFDLLRTALLKTDVVEEAAQSNSPVTESWSNQTGFKWDGLDPTSKPLFNVVSISPEYGKTIGWEVAQGRDFSREFGTDTTAFVLNEAAVKMIGMNDIVGKTIIWNEKPMQVVGVAKDMITQSPYEPVQPTVFFQDKYWVDIFTIRLKAGVPIKEALAKVEGVYKELDPASPFEYKFTDEEYDKKFQSEERIGKLARVFAILAVFISCLGLFGLSAFVAEQRTKEIGIRKVLGATVADLWAMQSKGFVVLVILSLAIASPLAWYFLKNWLKDYEYHVTLGWQVFALSGILAVLVTLLTVSFQSVKAALANPVKSLRSE